MKTLRLLNYLMVAAVAVTLLLSCGDKEQKVAETTKADSLIGVAHKNHEYERLLELADTLQASGHITAVQADYWRGYAYSRQRKMRMAEMEWKNAMAQNVKTDETRFLESEALFVSVGRVPNTEFLQGAVSVDGSGYIEADETTRTSVPGVFAVGDIRTKPMRQVVTAAADGAVSSMFAQQYIEELKAKA